MADVTIAVIGGGLAGLVAADALAESGASVVLLEAQDRLGGQVRTEWVDDFVVEHGAEGFVARSEAVAALAAGLGLADSVIEQRERRALVRREGALHPLGSGDAARLLGIQADEADLGQGLRSLAGGMGSLVVALARRLERRAEVRTGAQVVGLEPTGAGWRCVPTDGSTVEAERVVLAVPAHPAARLLSTNVAEAAEALGALAAVSSLEVTLGIAESRIAHLPPASGVVLARLETDELRAVAIGSAKFPGRATTGRALLRVFYRPSVAMLAVSDVLWVRRAERDLEVELGIVAGDAEIARVSRWPDALPRYAPDHEEVVRRAREAARAAGIVLAGAAYDGTGVDGAVRSGLAAAGAVVE